MLRHAIPLHINIIPRRRAIGARTDRVPSEVAIIKNFTTVDPAAREGVLSLDLNLTVWAADSYIGFTTLVGLSLSSYYISINLLNFIKK